MSEPRSCGSCVHAEMTVLPPCEHEDEGTVAYECRRFPPTVLVVNDDGGAGQAWPIVQSGDWCGEHTAPSGSSIPPQEAS